VNNLFVELRNLFKSIENYNCFVCSDTNPIGLNLDIQFRKNSTYAYFNLSNLYSGFPSVVHGGIQATIIDEIGFWAMFNTIKRLGFTKSLSVEYLSKIEVNKELNAVGKIIEVTDDLVSVEVEILSDSNSKTRGIVEYKLISDNVIKKYFGLEFHQNFNRIINNDKAL
jgi:hypothetical protein